MADVLNALVLLANFLIVPGLTYGSVWAGNPMTPSSHNSKSYKPCCAIGTAG